MDSRWYAEVGIATGRRGIHVQRTVARRDVTIGATSILAKVTRDRLLLDLDARWPQYGFARHKS
jgi:ribonuclease HII